MKALEAGPLSYADQILKQQKFDLSQYSGAN